MGYFITEVIKSQRSVLSSWFATGNSGVLVVCAHEEFGRFVTTILWDEAVVT